jgi:hypothetical protein
MTARLRIQANDGGEPEALLAAAQRRLDAGSAVALAPVPEPTPAAPAPVTVAPDDEALIETPMPKRRARARRAAAPASGAAPADGGDPAGLLAAAKAAGEPVARGESPLDDKDKADSGRLRRKLVARRGAPMSTDTLGGDGPLTASAASAPRTGWRRWLPRAPALPAIIIPAQVWLVTAGIAFLAVLVLTVSGAARQPSPLPVTALRVVWRPGPRLPADEIAAWLRRSPVHDQLGDPNAWVLDQLADWLRQQPAVDRLVQVRLAHEPSGPAGSLRRVLEIELALRTPAMPAVLASGERAWVDAEGHVLPGELPAPRVSRPVLRQLESAGPDTVRSAIDMWTRLEPDIPPGLVGDILCDDQLNEQGARGIVLVTRQGARLLWGAPGEQRYGVSAEDRAAALIHALRCQGDLAHVASIDVRFRQPVLVLKD